MIVTTGRHIKIEAGGFLFERSCESPGKVTVYVRKEDRIRMALPVNEGEREQFIAAYRRACEEAIEYRESKVEPTRCEPAK